MNPEFRETNSFIIGTIAPFKNCSLWLFQHAWKDHPKQGPGSAALTKYPEMQETQVSHLPKIVPLPSGFHCHSELPLISVQYFSFLRCLFPPSLQNFGPYPYTWSSDISQYQLEDSISYISGDFSYTISLVIKWFLSPSSSLLEFSSFPRICLFALFSVF